jgi:pyridoxine 5-phosphate synthase
MNHPLKLGVNIDHVATVRQARGTVYPDTLEAARVALAAGGVSITMHLREDRRHIQDDDIYRFAASKLGPLNLEMANSPEIVEIALKVLPAEVCLVPEKREELTTEGGLDVRGQFDALKPTVEKLSAAGIEVSLFIEACEGAILASSELGAHVVELHTGSFCDASEADRPALLAQLIKGAEFAHSLGLKVNAGHGINMETIEDILKIPHLDTLNIGHSIIARAVFLGLEGAVKEMLGAMARY